MGGASTKHDWLGFLQRNRARNAIAVFVACFAVYFAVLEAFFAIPLCNTAASIRPAAGIGPTFGLFFGLPGALGCSGANLVSDALHGEPAAMLVPYFLVQTAYNALPYLVWYAMFRKSASPYPRLSSVAKTGTFLALALVDSLFVSIALTAIDGSIANPFQFWLGVFLNDLLFIFYLGMPLLVALEKSPFRPHAPRWIAVPYAKKPDSMTQRMLLVFVGIATVVMVLLCVATIPFTNIDSIEGKINFAHLCSAIFTATVLAPMLAFMWFLEKKVTLPVERLTRSSADFMATLKNAEGTAGKGADAALDVPEDGLDVENEMRQLFDATNALRHDLIAYVDELAEATSERERSAAELDIARRIQTGAVPRDFAEITRRFGLEADAVMKPAREVGGDFYDVFQVDGNEVAFVVGDVSGKGVPAALFMMRAQSLIKQHILTSANLGDAFARANEALCEGNDALLFVTAFACVVNTETGFMRMANAGHNPPSARRCGKRAFLSCRPGLVLGAIEGVPYREESMQLAAGDSMVLYTDGVTEAFNAAGAMFGDAGLAAALKKADAKDARDLAHLALRAVSDFANGAAQSDDITVLSFAWHPYSSHLEVAPDDSALNNVFEFLKGICDRHAADAKTLNSLRLVCEEAFVNVCHYGFPNEPNPAKRPPVIFDAVVENDECGGDGSATDAGEAPDAQASKSQASAPDAPKSLADGTKAGAPQSSKAQRTLHLVMSDAGIPYNPLEYKPEKVEAGVEHRIGGLGVLLMRELLDNVTYERANGRNILRMEKYL